jgi:hypothetical protein
MIGLELEIISRKIDRYGWDGINDHVRQRLLSDWIDALADFTLAEVKDAVNALLACAPKDAMNEQKVRSIVVANRDKRLAAIPKPADPEPPREIRDQAAKDRMAEVARSFTTRSRK